MKAFVALGLLGVVAGMVACGGGSQGPQGSQGAAGQDGKNGEAGATGMTGPAGSSTPPNASVSGVTPPHAFLARSEEVTLSGYGTSWSASTTVDFGAGIKVDKLTVASPTALVAAITIDKAAATGTRDVTVKDGTNSETYKGAFDVESPLAITYQGTLAQGSTVVAVIDNLDTSTPLDTTSDPLTGAFTNLALTVPAGVTQGQILSATPFAMQVQLFIDVPTAAGMVDLDLTSGPASDPTDVDFPAPKSMAIAARTPNMLTANMPATAGSTAAKYDTSLYEYVPAASALTIVDFTVGTTSSTATPAFVILDSTGKWANQLAYGQSPSASSASFSSLSAATSPMYGITFDGSGSTGPFSVGVATVAPALSKPTVAGDGTKATAIAAGANMPFVLTGADLAVNGTSGDWVQVTVAANKTLHVQTVGDYLTDVAVSVWQSNGTTQVGATYDGGGQADTTFAITTAGTYYVSFTPGQYYAAPDTKYQAILRTN